MKLINTEKKVTEDQSIMHETRSMYDEATLAMLRETSEEYLSGKARTYTMEESKELIEQNRKKR